MSFENGSVYFIVYILLYCFAFLGSTRQLKNGTSLFLFFSTTLIILFLGLRWECGTDWATYKYLFDSLELDWTFVINVYRFEFGYVLLNYFVKLASTDYTIFLLVNATLTIIPLAYLLKKESPYPNLSFLLFYSIYFLPHFMGSNRRMIAIVLVLFAFYYLYNSEKKKYFLFIFLAFLFHKSSIIGLFIYFIYNKNFNMKYILIGLVICVLIGITGLPTKVIQMLSSFLSSNYLINSLLYYSTESVGNVSLSQMLLALARRSIFLVLYLYVLKKNKVDSFTMYFFYIYILGFMIYSLFLGYPILQVATTYLAIVEIILFARMFTYLNFRPKIFVFSFLLFYCFVQLLTGLAVYPDEYMPYRSVLNL